MKDHRPGLDASKSMVAALNDVMRQLGYKTTFAIVPGGWVREHHRETGNTFAFRTPELAAKLRARRAQLERMQGKQDDMPGYGDALAVMAEQRAIG